MTQSQSPQPARVRSAADVMCRDTIVVGASSGGIPAIRELLARLSPELPASVLVVQHQASIANRLPEVFQAATRLPVSGVDAEQPLHRGHVYVAPPDQHMVVRHDRVTVIRGARENRARPAINPLFRTAAAARASRVIGVQLTGLLDDGAAGLAAIARCGGRVVVQDPEDAAFPEMPRHALEAVPADYVTRVEDMGDLLVRLVREEAPPVDVPEDVRIEASLHGPGGSEPASVEAIGEQVPVACPECGGPMWAVGPESAKTYRCHTGHALSARALLESQSEEIEQALWAAVRALSERAATLAKLATGAGASETRLGRDFEQRAAEAMAQSEQARRFLLSLRMNRPDEDRDQGHS